LLHVLSNPLFGEFMKLSEISTSMSTILGMIITFTHVLQNHTYTKDTMSNNSDITRYSQTERRKIESNSKRKRSLIYWSLLNRVCAYPWND